MSISDILTRRLRNQLLTHQVSYPPEEVVAWFGAIQAQDFPSAKWAIGLRGKDFTQQQVEEAFNQGKILRTHVLRPTWHFVTPKDIRWLLRLTRERVHKLNSYYYRQLGLSEQIFEKCMRVIRNSLQGNTYLTREEIGVKLKDQYSFTREVNLTIGYILIYAELEGIICSGPKRGKQFTYALLEERVPKTALSDIKASLTELTLRYFQSHGPATIQDFVWWSGLTTVDAKKGIESIRTKLNAEKIGENVYWFINSEITKMRESKIFLLPNYDEYIIGYKDRSFIFDSKHIDKLDARANPLFQHTIISNGKVIGIWKKQLAKNATELNTNIFEKANETQKELLKQTIEKYKTYLKTE